MFLMRSSNASASRRERSLVRAQEPEEYQRVHCETCVKGPAENPKEAKDQPSVRSF